MCTIGAAPGSPVTCRAEEARTAPLSDFAHPFISHCVLVVPAQTLRATRISQDLLDTASRLRSAYSPACTPTLAAMVRIAWYTSSVSVEKIEEECTKKLSLLNAAAKKLVPSRRCPHFIATDWFAGADRLPKAHEAAVQGCWERTMGLPRSPSSLNKSHADGENVPAWWRQDDLFFSRAIPSKSPLVSAYFKDKATLKAMVDVAMLVVADVCIQSSHLSSIASNERELLGKSPCIKLESMGL